MFDPFPGVNPALSDIVTETAKLRQYQALRPLLQGLAYLLTVQLLQRQMGPFWP